MGSDDARAVFEVFATADGGCRYCAEELYEVFLERWPEHVELAITEYARHFTGTRRAQQWREDYVPAGGTRAD